MIINGKDVMFYVLRDSAWKETALATSVTMELVQELVPVASNTSATSRAYSPVFTDMSITLDGVMTIDELPRWQLNEWLTRTSQTVLLRFVDSNGINLAYRMTVWVESVTSQNSGTDFSTYSIKMIRSGAHTVVNPPTVVSMDVDAGDVITFVFSEAVTPTTAGWTIKVNGVTMTNGAWSGTGTGWDLDFTGDVVTTGDVVLVSYNALTGNTIGVNLNEVETFTDVAATNNM